jgi:hypothetical protein
MCVPRRDALASPQPAALLRSATVVAEHARRAAEAGERGALLDSLQVDRQAVLLLADLAHELTEPGDAGPATPVVHAVDRRVPLDQRPREVVDDPPDFDGLAARGGVLLERRSEDERVDHVADRAEADDQDLRRDHADRLSLSRVGRAEANREPRDGAPGGRADREPREDGLRA